MMLELRDIDAGYGTVQVLRGLSLQLAAGEVLCLLGRNGAGKTTLMKTILGLADRRAGSIRLDGVEIGTMPAYRIPRLGVGYVPQGRRLFGEMTVAENLRIGQLAGDGDEATRNSALAMFPRLEERLGQRADTLSGGEQQMLAMARALCLGPRVLLLDEPTEGLQPSMIALIRDAASALAAGGVAVLLVEQRVEAVLEIADRVAFLENGRLALDTTPDALRADESLVHRYVGV